MALATVMTGCFGDGTFGHQHTRIRCAEALVATGAPNDLVAPLYSDMSDDGSEEDDACDFLNGHAPVEGHFWGWQDGDFGLWPHDDRETLP